MASGLKMGLLLLFWVQSLASLSPLASSCLPLSLSCLEAPDGPSLVTPPLEAFPPTPFLL